MADVLPFEEPISTRELAQHLRRMMDLAGSNPDLLAKQIGVPRSNVYAWLYGRNLDKAVLILGAVEALGCTVKILPPRQNM